MQSIKDIKSHTFLLFLLYIICSYSEAQDFSEDILKVNNAFKELTDASMTVKYTVYENHESNEPIQTEFGTFLKNQDIIYTELLGIKTILTDDFTLVILDQDKKLILDDPQIKGYPNLSIIAIDSVLMFIGSSTLIKDTDQEIIYHIEPQKDIPIDFDAFDIYIDKSTYLYSKIVLYYRKAFDFSSDANPSREYQKPRIEIQYNKGNKIIPGDKRLNQYTFLKVKDDQFIKTDKYEHYDLVNLLNSSGE